MFGRFSIRLFQESDLERILQTISEMLAETLDTAVCSILLVDEEKKELTVSAARCSACRLTADSNKLIRSAIVLSACSLYADH